jgi:hypothetical protein
MVIFASRVIRWFYYMISIYYDVIRCFGGSCEIWGRIELFARSFMFPALNRSTSSVGPVGTGILVGPQETSQNWTFSWGTGLLFGAV